MTSFGEEVTEVLLLSLGGGGVIGGYPLHSPTTSPAPLLRTDCCLPRLQACHWLQLLWVWAVGEAHEPRLFAAPPLALPVRIAPSCPLPAAL